MTRIATTGTKTAVDVPELSTAKNGKGLLFTGTLPTTLEVGVLVENTFVALTGGGVTAAPYSFYVQSIPPQGLALNVTGGSPNFVITSVGSNN
jgi:hypothetical protein